jgi:enoyl-CoA hydratase
MGISYFLPRLVGASRAFDLMVTGRAIGADEAYAVGLLSQVFDDEELAERTLETAKVVAGYTSVGLRMTKEAMWANLDASDLESCLALENRNQDLAGQNEEVRAYMQRYRNTIGAKASE